MCVNNYTDLLLSTTSLNKYSQERANLKRAEWLKIIKGGSFSKQEWKAENHDHH